MSTFSIKEKNSDLIISMALLDNAMSFCIPRFSFLILEQMIKNNFCMGLGLEDFGRIM
jgi:hypothetical protein